MTCRRILEYKALMATPAYKPYKEAFEAYMEAQKAKEEELRRN